jgi:hypothetical protein
MKYKKNKKFFEISEQENLMYIRTHLKLLFNDLSDIDNELALNIKKNGFETNNDFINDEIDKKRRRIILRKKKDHSKKLMIPQTFE